MMNQKIIVADIKSTNIDGKSEGHYFSVARNYLEMLKDVFDIKVAGGPVYHNAFKSEELLELKYDVIPNRGKVRNAVHTFLNGFLLLKSTTDSTIIFQCCAVSVLLFLLAIIKPKVNVFLIQYDCMIGKSKLKTLLYKRAKKHIKGIICPGDEVGQALNLPYCVVPDYIYIEKQWTESYGSSKKYDFGMYGMLTQGKGIYEAAKFLAGTGYIVKIAGKASDSKEDTLMMQKLVNLSKDYKNIDLEFGYLSDFDYKKYLAETKFVVLNYTDNYALRSSGVILDAIYSNTPVVARDRKYVQFVKDNGLGVVYTDFGDINLQYITSKEQYDNYQRSILAFLKKQKMELDKVIRFIGG